jgi:hypothetical protein
MAVSGLRPDACCARPQLHWPICTLELEQILLQTALDWRVARARANIRGLPALVSAPARGRWRWAG